MSKRHSVAKTVATLLVSSEVVVVASLVTLVGLGFRFYWVASLVGEVVGEGLGVLGVGLASGIQCVSPWLRA